MVDVTNDLIKQAQLGSIAAIIQLLNDDLASIGVRVRAVRDGALLQLLCEAETVEPLEKSSLVAQIRQILESIGLYDIRRVKINTRLVQEKQLLWLQEINRDGENQLLWAEEIQLTRANPLKRLLVALRLRRSSVKLPIAKPSSYPFARDRRQLRRGMIFGSGLSLSLLLLAGALYKWFGPKQADSLPYTANAFGGVSGSTAQLPSDPFTAAVRIAEQTSIAGQNAETPAQWLEIASRWQKASDLMAQISSEDERYKTAQNRKELYRQNSESALKEAQRRRS
jgi:hypothetical protein